MSRPPPLGFFSYATMNDVHTDGRLSELREVLEAEVRDHGVSDFQLFQDKSAIRGGDDWKQEIREKLHASTVLIPLVTPTFFERPWCKWEVETFLERREMSIERLIAYPLYLIHDEDWEDDEWRDEFRASLHRFQARDLRSHRHAGFRTGPGRARVAELGQELAQKLKSIARREIVVGRGLELLRERRWAEAAKELRRGKLEEEAKLCERLATELITGRSNQAAVLLKEAPRGWMDEGWRMVGELLETQTVPSHTCKLAVVVLNHKVPTLGELGAPVP
jgi:hypothetical protein